MKSENKKINPVVQSSTSTNDLAELLVDAIIDEPFIRKETLLPKIIAIIKGFRLSLSTANYDKAKNKSETARLIRTVEMKQKEVTFFKEQLKALVGQEGMNNYYEKLDVERKKWQQKNNL